MKWLDRWFAKKCKETWESAQEDRIIGGMAIPAAKVARGSDIDGEEGLNITVRNANGGKIISFRHYDHKIDRNTYKLYVIPDDHDFEKELGKLITLESMRF